MTVCDAELAVTNAGGLVLVDALSERAIAWLEHFVGPDSTWLGESLVVESRYVGLFLNSAADAGFSVTRGSQA